MLDTGITATLAKHLETAGNPNIAVTVTVTKTPTVKENACSSTSFTRREDNDGVHSLAGVVDAIFFAAMSLRNLTAISYRFKSLMWPFHVFTRPKV
jgi:hypothetical protein